MCTHGCWRYVNNSLFCFVRGDEITNDVMMIEKGGKYKRVFNVKLRRPCGDVHKEI